MHLRSLHVVEGYEKSKYFYQIEFRIRVFDMRYQCILIFSFLVLIFLITTCLLDQWGFSLENVLYAIKGTYDNIFDLTLDRDVVVMKN